MKMKLVFPPAWETHDPYPSLPCLDAYLKMKGHDVEQVDMNLEVFDYLLSSQYLNRCLQEIKAKGILKEYINFVEYLADNIDQCKNTRRSEAALDPIVYKKCTNFFSACLFIINSIWKTEGIAFNLYVHNDYEAENSQDVCRCIEDTLQGRLNSRLADIMSRFVDDLLSDAQVIGFSVTHKIQILPAFMLAAMCKKANPDIKIVFGGTLATRLTKTPEVFRGLFRVVDYFSFFEGEVSLDMLMRHLKGEIDISQVPAIGYLRDGEIIINPAAAPLSMNELPTPVYNKKNLGRYFFPVTALTLFSCRGCYWNRCTFCSHAAIYCDCFRARKVELIIEDIETCIKEYGAHYFSFNDEAMTAPVMKKLSGEIISRNLDIKWMNDSRLDKALDEETLKLAYQSGLKRLLFGLESYNERILSLMNKGIKREWVEPIIKASSAAGIWTHIFIIGGFPTETKEEFEETCEFIRKNNIYIDSTNVTPFTATRFSDVTMNPHKYNLEIINDDHLDLSPNSESRMTDPSDNLTHPIRFDLTGHAPASGNKFLEIYDNPAFMIFADYLKECTQRAKLGEEPSTPIGTPIYSKNSKVEYITAFNQQDKFTIVRVPESAEPFVAALDNNYLKSDAYKELSEITGYPAPVLDIMVERVRASLIK